MAGDGKKPASPFAALAALKAQLPEGTPPAVARPAAPVNRRFAGKLVVAKTRKGRGGRTVTVVRGIDARGEQLEAIAKELKKALGCGASVDAGPICQSSAQVTQALTHDASARGTGLPFGPQVMVITGVPAWPAVKR